MFCDCGDIGNSEGNLTRLKDCSNRLTCHALRKNACSLHFPRCNTTFKDSKNGKKFRRCRPFGSKVERIESAISPLIAENSDKRCSVKTKNKHFRKGLTRSSTSNNLSVHESGSQKSKNKHAGTSTQEPQLRSHFNSLKLKMRKLSSRIKKLKKRPKDSHSTILDIEQGYESSDEFSAETDSSTDVAYSPIKRTASPVSKDNSLAENLLPSFPKENLFLTSQFCPSFELRGLSKPLAPTAIDESDAHFGIQLDETTRTSISNCQSSGNDSSFYRKDSLHPFQLSLTPLHTDVSFPNEKDLENVIPWTARKDVDGKYSKKDRRNNCILKDSKNSKVSKLPIAHVNVKPIFDKGSDKSLSTTDERIIVPSSSNFEKILPPTHLSPSYSSTCLTADVNENKIFQLHFSGEMRQKLFQAETTKFRNKSLKESNEFAGSCIDSMTSSITQELNLTKRSFSLAKIPLLSSQQHSSSNLCLNTDIRSVSELSQSDCSTCHNTSCENQNHGKISTSRLVLSDLEDDFETLNIKSSASFSESESISSSEFLPCRYCRSLSSYQLNTDSVNPYYSLE